VIRRRALNACVALVLAASPYFGIPAWTPALATMVAFQATSLIGLNLIFGSTGLLALGQAAFAALPGYVSGILQKFGLSALLAIPIGIAVTIVLARIVAGVFIRLPGIYFAIGTLGFAFVLEGLVRALPSLAGGSSGLVLVLPVNLRPGAWYLVALSFVALGTASYIGIARGRFLRTLKLIRHDELAAEVLGIDVIRVKCRVFTIGCAFSAVGGVLLAYFTGVLVPENAGVNQSLEYLAMVIIGGAGTALGPLVGASAVQWLFAISGSAERYELLVYGLVFFFVVLFSPTGLVGLLERRRHAIVIGTTEPGPPLLPEAEENRPERAGPRGSDPVCLRVENASVRFGGLVAVNHVDLAVGHGQIVALIGPNGAGKSTLFNLISGILQPTDGNILLEGKNLRAVSIHDRASSIGRSFQVPRLVPDMTVLQNVAARIDHLPGRRREPETLTLARRQLGEFGLLDFADKPVQEVGVGHHKLIDVARAAAGAPPLLLLDEPAVGLSELEVEHLSAMLLLLKTQGAAILVVEHNIGFVTTIADRILVMNGGELIAVGTAAEVMANPAVQHAYFGAL